jgi:hypothetical protein
MTDEKPKRTKLRIVGDGHPLTTRIETDDGQIVSGVVSISWDLRNNDDRAECTLRLDNVLVEVDPEAE